MNIFGVGGAELVLIVIIMLIVAGPKRMVRWAYVIGQYVGKFRIVWEQMVDMLQDEVDAAGLDVKLPKEIPTKQNIAKTAAELMKPYSESIEKTMDEVKNPIKETVDETNKVVADAKKPVQETVDAANKAVEEANKAASEPKKQSPAESSTNLGQWNPDKIKQDAQASAKAESSAASNDTRSNFGAWSQPKSPDESIEREA